MAEIKQITTDELRRMDGQEGLILQGCGGDLREWVDGINDLLTEAGILLDGSRFESVSVFQHQELTNLCSPLTVSSWMWGSWPRGACRPTRNLVAPG